MGIILPIIATGLSVIGAVSEARAQKKELQYRRQVADKNAEISERNAQEATRFAAKEAQNRDRAARAIIGDTIAQNSASGLIANKGSLLLQRKTQGRQAARDRETIVDAGATDSRNYKEQAERFRAESGYLESAQSFNKLSGALNIASSLVGGARRYKALQRKSQARSIA